MKRKIQLFLALTIGTITLGTLYSVTDSNVIHQQATNAYRLLTTAEDSKAKRDKVCKLLDKSVDVEAGNIVSKADKDSWKTNKKTIASARSKNEMEDYMSGKSTDLGPFVIQSVKFAGAALVFTVLSLFGFFFYCICCVCQKCCPPCKCCCKCCKDSETPYTGIQKYWMPLGIVAFCVWVFVSAIIGLTHVGGIESSFNTFICAGLVAFHGIGYGGGEFKGTDWLQTQLQNFVDQDIGNITTETQSTFSGTPAWVNVENTVMDNISSKMKESNCPANDCQQAVSCTPVYSNPTDQPAAFTLQLQGDPAATNWSSGQACAGQNWNAKAIADFTYQASPSTASTTPVDSIYFNAGWGTSVNAATQLYQGSVTGIKTSVDGIEAAAGDINSQTSTISTALTGAIKSITDFQKNITNMMKDMGKMHDDNLPRMELITLSLTAYLWAFCVMSVILVIITALIFFKAVYKLRYVLHICWCVYSLLMIFTFLFATILLFIAGAGEQFCDVFSRLLSNPEDFDKYGNKFSKDIRDKIKICKKELNLVSGPYGGKDDITTAFNIESQLNSINNLKAELTSFIDPNGPMLSNLGKLQTVPNELDTILGHLTELKTTQKVPTTTQDEHPALETGISGFNSGTTACGTSDILVRTHAADSETTECGSTTQGTYSANVATTGAVCFEVQGSAAGAARYNAGGQLVCPTSAIEFTAINAWRTEKDTIVDLKTEQTTGLKNQLRYYIALHSEYVKAVTTFNTNVIASLDKISHPTDGILAQIKCFWFGQQLDNLHDAMCVSYVNNSYKLGNAMLWFSIGVYFCSFFIYFSARRMGVNQKLAGKPVQDFQTVGQQDEAKIL